MDRCFPINNREARCPHFLGGPWGGAGPCKDSRRGTLSTPLNLGEPFWCPRSACLKNGGMEVLQSAVGVDSVIGYRDRQVREAAKVEDTMTFNFTSQAPKGQSRRAWRALESTGEHWRALESTGEHWRALESTGEHWRALKITGENWRAHGEHWRALESTGEHWRAPVGPSSIQDTCGHT